MNDAEVVRLRRLRECALRSRAIARAMATNPQTKNDPLLIGGVGASWRIARAVSGKLKSHPNVPIGIRHPANQTNRDVENGHVYFGDFRQ